MKYSLRITLATAVIAALFTSLAIIGITRNHPASVPQPQITGSYSTKGLPVGNACHHSGPGWLLVPEGAISQVFQVKDAYYCAGITGAAVIPVKGKSFNLFTPFQFSKTDPGNR